MPETNLSRPGLTGDADTIASKRPVGEEGEKSWAERMHDDWDLWVEAERKQRASYVASRDELARFLVPHMFEGKDTPGEKLHRAGLGFPVGLNAMWVLSLMGHIRNTQIDRTWGPLGTGEITESGRPAGGTAQLLYDDVTLSDTSWPSFFDHQVLEWVLTSVGGWIVVDAKEDPGAGRRRPAFRWFPWSSVENYSWGKHGPRQVKFAEIVDNRDITAEDAQDLTRRHVLYELRDDGSTVVGRYDDEGDLIGDEVEMGTLRDFQGHPTLPLVDAGFGTHPSIRHVHQGLLYGLDDIVIDLFNLVTEAREGFRDSSFSALAYRGDSPGEVKSHIEEGSMFWPLGADPDADISRIAGDSAPVDAGMNLFDAALKAWALSARRKSVEAMEGAEARSGVSLKAEFQLDERPLLTVIAGEMDDIESKAMLIAAQVDDENLDVRTNDELQDVGVNRSTEFNLEEEESRITRVLREFREAFGGPPPSEEAQSQIIMRFLEESDLVDMDEELEDAPAETRRELIRQQVEDSLETRRARRRNGAASPFGGGGLQLR